ncbi:hypothetical protein K1719_034758 [Acacia pycnantha]|nr:hypothetical protein K1719_034758 [Acacia pycnantha]
MLPPSLSLICEAITGTRVFLLGSSHHYYTPKCALSVATVYKTPIGDLPIDLEVNEELKATEKFELMDIRVDEAEHSMEMHLPYLAKVFEGLNIAWKCICHILPKYSKGKLIHIDASVLKATGKFELMDIRVDEAEHSMEMHLPYLAKVFEG